MLGCVNGLMVFVKENEIRKISLNTCWIHWCSLHTNVLKKGMTRTHHHPPKIKFLEKFNLKTKIENKQIYFYNVLWNMAVMASLMNTYNFIFVKLECVSYPGFPGKQ